MSLPDVLPPRLAPGDPVEVQNRFDGSWCTGFEIAEVLGSPPHWTYRIRRLSDGEVLPRIFDHDAVTEAEPTLLASPPQPSVTRARPPVQPAVPYRLAS